ncbi:MAG: HAD-IA family hydrolase [Erysipelotrichaceae bacterium]|nr:HAD-IA family hydrolase [Erysipelotrichaceae bacterium]
MIRNIVFDLNGVLSRFHRRDFPLLFDNGLQDVPLLFGILTSREWEEHNLGMYPDTRSVLSAYVRHHGGDLERLLRITELFYGRPVDYNPKLVAFMAEHPGYDYYLLTNTTPEQGDRLEEADFLKYMKGIFCSYQEGLMKPDRAFYERFLQKYDLQAGECLFLDDKRENTAAAKKLGFHVITYRYAAQLAHYLEKNKEFGLLQC